ncbi:YjbH domain-containing protein [Rhodobacter xanthinilyticus]|nr:YjbH domain-containing protein [Rhodobacter xanthinilyticus]
MTNALTSTAIPLLLCAALGWAGLPARADGLSSYGTPGLIDMPSATPVKDGLLIDTLSALPEHYRNSTAFQITPRISGVFRYSILENFGDRGNPNRYDRSFDLHVQLRDEGQYWPALALGLRDFGGTGLFSSEYVVASKHFGPKWTVTGGMGWGRLASYGGFSNPLGAISDRFKTRPGGITNITQTGRVNLKQFFRGDAALFGGIEYQLNDRTRLIAEYSSDDYATEVRRMGFEHKTPINLGVEYQASRNLRMGLFTIGGAQIGAKLTYVIDPRAPSFPGGAEKGYEPLRPRVELAGLGWDEADGTANRARLDQALRRQGLTLESYRQTGAAAEIVLDNRRYPASAQALGRAARAMANSLPPEIDRFEIVLARGGVPQTRVSLRRSDLEALEHAEDGSWKSFARAQISDAPSRLPPDPGVYPRLEGRLGPYYALGIFDPDAPLRYQLGAEFETTSRIAPGVSVSSTLRVPLVGTLSESTRPSNSILPHVRSDQALYDKADGLLINRLTADYLFRPGPDLFGRLSAGYLEQMYAGVSAELLWAPVNSRLALGGEINYVAQRDFDQRFGLQDYRVATGHLSAYYDFGGGYLGQLDVGRYLARDWGATFSLDREFDNGFKVGAFFTLTDVPFDDFGEGSFDKGIRFSIPTDWLTGQPAQGGLGQTIRPVQRDGGARLAIANRLYAQVRADRTTELEDRWGKFWR